MNPSRSTIIEEGTKNTGKDKYVGKYKEYCFLNQQY